MVVGEKKGKGKGREWTMDHGGRLGGGWRRR
jgi:hypothetical protein